MKQYMETKVRRKRVCKELRDGKCCEGQGSIITRYNYLYYNFKNDSRMIFSSSSSRLLIHVIFILLYIGVGASHATTKLIGY
jgi:hypothetical protein